MILLAVLAVLAIMTVIILALSGAGFIIVFADIIVAAAFIVFVIRQLLKK